MTRLLGRTSWYLNRQDLTGFRTLAGSKYHPRAGTFNLELGPYVSATGRKLQLRPSGAASHESLWAGFEKIMSQVHSKTDEAASPQEYRLYGCITDITKRLGPSWPSGIRNLVNYVPGRAYREVIGVRAIDISSYVRQRSPLSVDKLISGFEDELVRVKAVNPYDDLALLCRLLLIDAICITELASGLHRELVERGSDGRGWLNARRSFMMRHCAGEYLGVSWPLT
jgi:hypothetical protein